MTISFGPNIANDAALRLCGELNAKRTLELGVSDPPNAVAMALAGAKAIAVDPDPERIATVRAAAKRHDIHIECHLAQLADLGEVASASLDLVVAVHALGRVDDVPRLLRQVHRVLKPGASFVVSDTHPVGAMFAAGDAPRSYGADGPTLSALYMMFERSNFHIDALHELGSTADVGAPTALVARARKQGI